MDKISKLLAEARPMYQRKKRERRAMAGVFFSFLLFVGIWTTVPTAVPFDDNGFDTYFTALYLSDDLLTDEGIYDGVLSFDIYGLYEAA